MPKDKSESIVVPSKAVQQLLHAIAVMPHVTNCGRCGTELLHVDTTFVSFGGKTFTLPLPLCPNCHQEEVTEAPAA